MNIVHLVLFQFILFGLVSVPLAYFTDPDGVGYLAWYTEKAGIEAVIRAYRWTVYAAVILTLCFYLTGIRRRISAYQQRSEVIFSRQTYGRLWLFAFAAGLACTLFLYVQSGYRHLGLMGISLDYLDYALLRVQASETINMNVYNLGLNLFVFVAMIAAVFYLKDFWRIAATAVLFVTLGAFSLAKAPMASAVLVWIFFYFTTRRPSLAAMGFTGVIVAGVLVLMYEVSKSTVPDLSVFSLISRRIFYGQFADLPYYLDYFETIKVSLASMLPPYVQHWMGWDALPPAGRLIMEYTNPAAVAAGSAGVANTLFIGEAYAWGGFWGVVLAPFWVGLHFWFVTVVFTRFKKSIWSGLVLAYLFYRMSDALISGFSYFIFSGIHIMLIFVAGTLVIRDILRIRRTHSRNDAAARPEGSREERQGDL